MINIIKLGGQSCLSSRFRVSVPKLPSEGVGRPFRQLCALPKASWRSKILAAEGGYRQLPRSLPPPIQLVYACVRYTRMHTNTCAWVGVLPVVFSAQVSCIINCSLMEICPRSTRAT